MSGSTGYTALGNAPVVVDAVAVPVTTDRVEVIAPATLPGGYELHCDFQGRPLVVCVVRFVATSCSALLYLTSHLKSVEMLSFVESMDLTHSRFTDVAPGRSEAGPAVRGGCDPSRRRRG